MPYEQGERENGKYQCPKQRVPAAPRNPCAERQQGETGGEQIVHKAPEQDVVVKQQKGHCRPDADMAMDRYPERDRAGQHQQDRQGDEDFAGHIDRHEPRQQRHDELHRHVRMQYFIDDVIAL